MKNFGVFDILGPIMIGPSSSHTAGAARLGKIGGEIASPNFTGVTFYLHGSFAKTYRGHGTDRALVAGILGYEPSDERIKDSLNIAKNLNLDIRFQEKDLGYVHPNTVKIVFHYKDREDYYLIGSSIGGGNIIITNLNGIHIEFTGNFPTILIKYTDRKGAISRISSVLANQGINIATMKVSREGKVATMVMEIDNYAEDDTIEKIEELEEIIYITKINPIGR